MLWNHNDADNSHSPVVVGDEDVVLWLGDAVMKQCQLLMQVVMQSIVAARAADVNCLRVIPDNRTSLNVTLISAGMLQKTVPRGGQTCSM